MEKKGVNSNGELCAYLARFQQYPVLRDHKTFLRLLAEHRFAPSTAARKRAHHQLVYGNVRLIVRWAKLLADMGLSVSDLMQEGVIGIQQAIETFDPQRGLRFSTHAGWHIRSCLFRAIQNTGERFPFRIPAWKLDDLRLIRRIIAEERSSAQSPTTPEHVYERVRHIKTRRAQRITLEGVRSLMALNAQRYDALDTLIVHSGPSVEERVECDLSGKRVRALVEKLPPRTIFILRHRYGFDGVEIFTLKELAAKLDLSYEGVRQIEIQALRTLRRVLASSTDSSSRSAHST